MDPKTFLKHFDTIAEAPGGIQRLRELILDLAVRGKLEPQDPGDDPARNLLTAITEERNGYIRQKQLKITGEVIVPDESELPPLPDGWEYCHLQHITTFGPRNGYSPKAVEYSTPVRSITLTAVTSGRFNGAYYKYIDEEIDVDSHLWLKPGDLLIQRSNTLAYVGSAAVYDQNPSLFIYPDLIMRIRVSNRINVKYIHLVISSKASKDYFQKNASGTSGTMPKIKKRL